MEVVLSKTRKFVPHDTGYTGLPLQKSAVELKI